MCGGGEGRRAKETERANAVCIPDVCGSTTLDFFPDQSEENRVSPSLMQLGYMDRIWGSKISVDFFSGSYKAEGRCRVIHLRDSRNDFSTRILE